MKLFFSYASVDQVDYKVEKIVNFLEFQDEIERVFYWERDTKGGETFDNYMRNNIKASDLVIVLFTPNTINSVPVIEEIGIAKAFQKQIMPIFNETRDIFANVQASRGISYRSNFRMFCEDLYHKITGKEAKFKEIDPLMELREDMYNIFQFNKLRYVEPELRDITGIFKEDFEQKKKIPLISYRIFNFILFDPLNRGSLNIIIAPSGSGKSLFVESLKHDILHREQLSSYVPFLINAKDINIDEFGLLNAFYEIILPNTEEKYFTNLESLAKSGKAIFLLDGLSQNSEPLQLLKKLQDFVSTYNARMVITCRPIIHEYTKKFFRNGIKYNLYELNTFKSTSLFEWIVLNKNNFDQTRHHQARDIYRILKVKVKEKNRRGDLVVLPELMQDFSL